MDENQDPTTAQDQDLRTDEQLVKIYSTADSTDGMLAKARLEAEGIPVFLKGGAEDQLYGGSLGTFLFVGEDDAARAKEIMEDVKDGDFQLADGEDPEAAV